jgi:formate hydrogenlyase subunit 4
VDRYHARISVRFAHILKRVYKRQNRTKSTFLQLFSDIDVFTVAALSMADLILSGVVLLSFTRPGDLIHWTPRSIIPAEEGIKTYGT